MNLRMKLPLKNSYKIFVLTSLLFALLASSAVAIIVPPLTGRVADNANMLSSSQKAQITGAIKKLENDTGGQMAILIIDSLKGDYLEGFASAVEDKWKIGHKGKDDGLLLIIVKNDRKVRIEVGYGWEQYVTDARAGDIIRAMGSYFRKGEFAQGILNAVNEVNSYVTGKPATNTEINTSNAKRSNTDSNDIGGSFIFWLFFAVFILAAMFGKSSIGTYGTIGSSGRGFFGGTGGSGGGSGGFSGGGGSSGGGGASGGW